jgi:hypothetical protein
MHVFGESCRGQGMGVEQSLRLLQGRVGSAIDGVTLVYRLAGLVLGLVGITTKFFQQGLR